AGNTHSSVIILKSKPFRRTRNLQARKRQSDICVAAVQTEDLDESRGGVMKRVLLSIGLVSVLALPASAQKKEEERVENAGTVMQEILNAPDSIPQDVLDKAECVVVLPSVVKFAIGIGGSYGRGVMTCRGGTGFQ